MKLIKLSMSNTPLKSSDLNVNAKEFVPRQNCVKVKLEKMLKEKILFDNLEKDFVKNNEWLFFV